MDKFIKRHWERVIKGTRNLIGRRKWTIHMILVFALLCLLSPFVAQAQEKLAVLPFKIYSQEPLEHLKHGLQDMLAVRMAKKGYQVIDSADVNRHPMVIKPSYEIEDVISLGKDLNTDWVVLGSLTQTGNKIDIDLKIVDVSNVKSPFSIFMVEDSVDRLADIVERAATSIDNQISGAIQIEEIRIKGNRRIEDDAILAIIKSKKGEVFDPDRLDEDLRTIYKMGYFKDVTIETQDGPNGKIITFNVVEKPIIVEISFEGVQKLKEEDLKEELGIKKYSVLNESEVNQSINRLKAFYRKKGFYNVEIKDRIEELSDYEVSLKYVIDEGDKVYITKIEFSGNEIFDDDDLKDIMETSEKGFWSWITDAGVLDNNKLQFDVQKITAFYHNKGYIDARTGDPEISYEEGKGLTVTIPVTEGKQFKINNVKIEGDLLKPEDELLGYVKTRKGASYSREVIHNDIQALKDLYANEGYAYTEVTPIPREDDENSLVDITFRIDKKKRVRFERINITGNSITRDKVIRRELAVVEGDYFSGTNLNKSISNLHRLGYFEDVEVNTKEGSQDDLMILDIEVKEQHTGTLSFGVGYSSFDAAIGTLQLAQRNLFGKGQLLSVQAYLGSRTTQVDLRFTEPWLFDRPISSHIRIFDWKTEYDEYTKDSLGGSLGLGVLLGIDEYTRGYVTYNYDNANVTDIIENAALVIKDMAGKNLTSSLMFQIERNSKDKPWDTSKGSVNSLEFEYAGGILGGDSYFNRYTASSIWFFPMWLRTVFVAKANIGYIDKRPGGRLPIYEKFRLGGLKTIRGYEWGTVSPLDPDTDDEIGGEKMWLYSLEYRFPLLQQRGLQGLVFFDVGNAFRKEDSWKTGARRGVGFGVRWYSPMGPIEVEYGIALDKRPGYAAGQLEFNIGGEF